MNSVELYEKCMRIRMFEKKVEEEFSLGHMRGTTHGCVGQEVIPVLVVEKMNRDMDYITGTHRCHGQVIAYTDDIYRLACEMMGKKDGFVKGHGGSQHIKDNKYITNGITGGMATVGTGIALGIKKNNDSGIVIAFLGDGGFNEGYVQESLNLAAYFCLPILFVCENNKYAMSTPTEEYSAGCFRDRIAALGINYIDAYMSNLEQLGLSVSNAFDFVRVNGTPCFLDVHAARLCGHSKSDAMEYMSGDEKERNIREDPVAILSNMLSATEKKEIEKRVIEEINDAFERANACAE